MWQALMRSANFHGVLAMIRSPQLRAREALARIATGDEMTELNVIFQFAEDQPKRGPFEPPTRMASVCSGLLFDLLSRITARGDALCAELSAARVC